MNKLDKLSTIRLCIRNDLLAIEQLEYHLEKLYEMEEEEIRKEEEALKGDFPL